MSDYQAGSAVASYKLDLTDFRKAAEEVRRFWQEQTRQKTTALPSTLSRGSSTNDAAGRQQAQALRDAARESDRAFRAFQQVERQIDRVRDSEIRAARASGDYSRALQLIDTSLERASAGTVRYNQLTAQRATVERQAAGETKGAADAFGKLGQAVALFGITLGIQQITQFATQSFALSQQLAQQERSLSVLTRDQNTYNEAIAIAKQNQSLFGGTLADNIDPLRTLTLNAQKYGIELKTLNDLSQRLLVLSPEQGAQGAGIALREALSGDTQSLVERFELPRAALAQIRDTSVSAADKLKILDGVLTSYGVTSQTVTDSITSVQQAQNRLNTEFETLRVAAGNGAAPAVEAVATGLSRLFGLLNDNPQALAELRAVLSGKSSIDQNDINQATQDIARRRTQQQIDVRDQRETIDPLSGAGAFTTQNPELIAALQALRSQLDSINAGSDDSRARLDALFAELDAGTLTTTQFAVVVQQLAREVQSGGSAFDGYRAAAISAADASSRQTTILGEQIATSQEAKEKSEQLAAAQADLQRLSSLVAAGLLSSGDAAAYMKAQYGLALPETELLINAQNRLAAARLAAANASNVQNAQAKVEADRRAGRTGRGDSSDAQEQTDAYARQAKARADALKAQQVALESTAQRAARLRQELAALRPGTTDFIEKQTELRLAQRQLDAEREAASKKGAKAYKTELNDAQRTADELVRIKRDQLQKLADAEEAYRQKQQRAAEDFAVRQSRGQEDYERQRRRLLAEGRRLEAQQLQEEYERQKQRDTEDFQRARRREQEDYQETRNRTLRDQDERLDDTQDKRDRRSQQRGYGGTSSTAAATSPSLRPPSIAGATGVTDVATSAALAPRPIQIAFQASVTLDGQKVGELVGPVVYQQIDEQFAVELSVISASQPIGLQQDSVREVR